MADEQSVTQGNAAGTSNAAAHGSAEGVAYHVGDCVPLMVYAAASGDMAPLGWLRIPSWRVIFHDCPALQGIDVRAHKSIDSLDAWHVAEATTGMIMERGHDGDSMETIIALFACRTLPRLTPEILTKALAKGRALLAERGAPSKPDAAEVAL